jgi:hypothetical protein
MDPDPAIFVIDLQEANKKLFFKSSFSAYYFLKVNLHLQGFSYYFCLMIEGSGAGFGFIPLISRSGSGRPKSMWIRIRIRNTAFVHSTFSLLSTVLQNVLSDY